LNFHESDGWARKKVDESYAAFDSSAGQRFRAFLQRIRRPTLANPLPPQGLNANGAYRADIIARVRPLRGLYRRGNNMRGFLNIPPKRANVRLGALVLLGLMAAFALVLPRANAAIASSGQEPNTQSLTVQAGFADKQSTAPDAPIELTLNRPLAQGEGRLAVVLGATDLTDLFAVSAQNLKYDVGKSFPLPVGPTELIVYLVAPNDDWKELARFPLRVGYNATNDDAKNEGAEANAEGPEPKTESQPGADASPQQEPPAPSQTEPPIKRRFGFDKLDFAPQLNIGFKSQFAEIHFPETNRPDRPTFTDATMQGTWKNEMARGAFNMQSQFDFIGSSFRNEALRFGDLQGRAPKVDLSSYSMQFQQGARKFTVGHTSFGAQRHLINNFASRGLTLAVPLGPHADISIMTMNSANIVGFDNFSGLANRRHRMHGAILGLEAFKSRPGGLRFEAGALDAWFTSNRQNFTQSNINDAERSRGYSARLLAKDKSERARLDGGFTRSRFFNPDDPLLNQGAAVQSSRAETRNARYVDASYDLFKDFVFKRVSTSAGPDGAQTATATQDASQPALEPKKLNLTLNFRHERVDPLFRSIGANTQADLFRNEAEFTGSYGELTFTAAHTRFNDNLGGIRTILRANTRRAAVAINTPLQGLFSGFQTAQPNPFLPRVGYTFERVRASADFIPIGGGFDQPGAIPDQANIVQSFVAEWQVKEIRMAYRLNHSLQDNRAVSRERADLQNFTHNATVGWNPLTTLELNLELNFEDTDNQEQARTDRTLRFGGTANWQATKRQTFNLTLSTIGAGDLARTTRNFNNEFDLQWSYRLTRENENRFKKVQANYFLRYANRFARARNFVENIDNLTKLQSFNTGLNFIFF
jgi:hypothetical protein